MEQFSIDIQKFNHNFAIICKICNEIFRRIQSFGQVWMIERYDRRKLRIKSNSSRGDKHVGRLKNEREIFRRKKINSFITQSVLGKIFAREIL